MLAVSNAPVSPAASTSASTCASTVKVKFAATSSSVCPFSTMAIEKISTSISTEYTTETLAVAAPAASMVVASKRASERIVLLRLRYCRSSSSVSEAPLPKLQSSPSLAQRARMPVALSCSPVILSMRKKRASRGMLSEALYNRAAGLLTSELASSRAR